MEIINTAYASSQETTEEAHTEVVHEQKEEGVLGSLGINGSLFVFQLINFAIVASILWFLILKPLTQKMSERQRKIEEGLNNAEKFKKKLEESEKEYDRKINKARHEASVIIEKAEKRAKDLEQDILDKANQEAKEIVNKAKLEIKAAKEESLKQIKSEAANMVVLGMEKILKKELDQSEQERIIQATLQEMDKINSDK